MASIYCIFVIALCQSCLSGLWASLAPRHGAQRPAVDPVNFGPPTLPNRRQVDARNARYPVQPLSRDVVDVLYGRPRPDQYVDCLLGCRPGQIIKSTAVDKVDGFLDSIDRGMQKKKAFIGITNLDNRTLVNPHYYLKAGHIFSDPPRELPKQRTLLLLFRQNSILFKGGTEGVLTYDIQDSEKRVALMWSVPKKDAKGVYFNMKVISTSTAVTKDLFNALYSADRMSGDGVLTVRTGPDGIRLEGVMKGVDTTKKEKIILRVDSTNLH